MCDAACTHALAQATGLDHDHGLVARSVAAGGHELAPLVHGFQVEEDRAGRDLRTQIVEHIPHVDVGTVPERDEVRETDAARTRPVEHRGAERARLGDQGEPAGQRLHVGEAGVQADLRHQDAQGVRAEDSQAMRLRGRQHLLLQLPDRSRLRHETDRP